MVTFSVIKYLLRKKLKVIQRADAAKGTAQYLLPFFILDSGG